MSLATTFDEKWQKTTAPLMQAFANLSKRDQLALLGLVLFLILFGVGFGGYALHKKANDSQKAYESTLSDVFLLRSQAGNIHTTNTNNPNQATGKADTIKQILAQASITNAQVIDNNGQIQLSFSHPQPAIVSNIFSQLTQQGIMIKQLMINQPTPEKVEVQAVLN